MEQWALRLVIASTWLAPSMPLSAQPVLGPAERIDALASNPSGVYAFIVRGDAATLAAAESARADDPSVGPPVELPLIDGLAVALHASDAIEISRHAGATQVWYVPRPAFAIYVRVIQSFQYVAANTQPPVPINLSLGPPAEAMPMAPHLEEPMNEATRRMSERGYIPVFAAGNYYDPEHPNPGVINPWCLPQWVICVGAARGDAKALWSGSARGLPSDPTSWPDVVADGVDVLGPWPTNLPKQPDRKSRDEASEVFRTKIPRDQWDRYTLMSGTSQATAQVTRAVAQITYFVQKTIDTLGAGREGQPIFSMTVPAERLGAAGRKSRLTGDIGETTPEGVVVTYRQVAKWRVVKQLLVDSALPMPGGPDEVGAGFVSPEYVERQFGRFGRAQPQLMPVKAM